MTKMTQRKKTRVHWQSNKISVAKQVYVT